MAIELFGHKKLGHVKSLKFGLDVGPFSQLQSKVERAILQVVLNSTRTRTLKFILMMLRKLGRPDNET